MTSTSTYLVIGASTGLGRATATALRAQHRVVTIGRRPEDEIKADLRDLADIARAANEAKALGPLAGIACNAGVQDAGTPLYTPSGLEQTFAVNVLAHVAFLAHLAPPKETHIGFVGSGTLDPDNSGARRMGFKGGIYTSAPTLAAGKNDESISAAQNGRNRYATSKLCDLLVVRALAARGVHAFAIDPGLMPGTGLARDYGPISRFLWSTVLRVVALAMPGASTTKRSGRAFAWALENAKPGAYVDYRRREMPIPAVAQRDDQAEDLYAHCLSLAGVADPF
ncbi:MAG TPA: SDR family NAD(P)-dependent oxidoreductase [Kofleriaceae bacterium]|jgi:NAD(P)-dependent dehydrogenase (short-subunit alcohol dehydrogenase family)